MLITLYLGLVSLQLCGKKGQMLLNVLVFELTHISLLVSYVIQLVAIFTEQIIVKGAIVRHLVLRVSLTHHKVRLLCLFYQHVK